MVLEFPIMADYAIIVNGANTIYATHGHKYNEDNLPPIQSGDILLNGHTHVPKCTKHSNYVYMNPGSVAIPKEGSTHSYLIIDGNEYSWKSLEDGATYLSYHS
jgi:predicted phosphodiesterase